MKGKSGPFPEIEAKMLEEHHRRYSEVLKLSIAASFAGLFFLLQSEQQSRPPSGLPHYYLEFAWAAFLVSALLGVVALACWVVSPARRLAALEIIRDPNEKITGVLIRSTLPWYERGSYWLHVALLFIGIVAAALSRWMR